MSKLNVGYLYDRCTAFYSGEIAVDYYGETQTYSQIRAQAYSLANALNRIGIGRGEKIAFLMKNCPEYIVSEYALAKNGYARVPLAVLLGNKDHVYMINQTECSAIIYHVKFVDRIREMLPELVTIKHFICVGAGDDEIMDGHLSLRNLIDGHEPNPPFVEVDPEELCGIYFTGGTTGLPKGVMLSHQAWVETVFLEMLETGIEAGERFAFLTPLTHAGGCYILPVLLRNGTCVIIEQFDPGGFLALVDKEKITCTLMVPTMLYMLLDHPDLIKYDLSSLRNILYGAAAIAPERLKKALEVFGPILTQFYGQTEAPMMISVLSRDEHVVADPKKRMEVFSSCGRPTLRTLVRIVDENGEQVKNGEVGEVIAYCPNLMSGYLKNPEESAKTIRSGWLYTGDLGKQDEEGYIFLVDRSKDMIISGGFNIYPREIEDVLFMHDAVKGAAVVGIPHEKWGEAVKAIVVLHENSAVTEEELIEFVKKHKGKLAAPKSVEFWPEIPLTNLGKVDKKKIRARYWEGQQRQI